MKLIGTVIHFDKEKRFGFLERKVVTSKGTFLQKYFFSPNRVDFVQDEIRVGCGALFHINAKPPKRPNQSAAAVNIEIFVTEVAAQEALERYQLIENAGGVE